MLSGVSAVLFHVPARSGPSRRNKSVAERPHVAATTRCSLREARRREIIAPSVLTTAVIALSILIGSAETPVAEPAPRTARTDASTAELLPLPSRPTLLVPVIHSAGVILGMRASLWALWPAYFDPLRGPENARNFRVAWTSLPEYDRRRFFLESDGDPWLLNAVGHGLFGSEIYLRMRGCGHGPMASLAAAAIASSAWEYGVEAFHQRPSAIDLVWTPLAGALLGEGRHQLYRLIDRSPRIGLLRSVGMILLDPFGEAEGALFGVCPSPSRARL